ncbi:MAG: mechanosensitive ion channel [Blautia sp.]|nr:mechanosensitive ion channel [Blautia sp.]
MKREPKILPDPAPFAGLCESKNEAMEFTARAWCRNEDYWDVYFYITQNITKAFEENNIEVPVVRIQTTERPGQNGVPYRS